jgi:hypothetical protein
MFASTRALRELVDAVSTLPAAAEDSERIDRIRLLEELKSVAAAAQAKETVEFAASQRAEQGATGMPAERVGRGIAAQVGLARRISPYRAMRYVGWAAVLTTELPATFRALREGRISEWRAMIVARETAWLSREHRRIIDPQLAPHLESWGDRRVEGEAKAAAYRLDPLGYLARIRGAEKDRHVVLRPAPDPMCRLTGFLPVAQGVAAFAALKREADARVAEGDGRSRGQIMADTFVERVTGQACATDVPVEVNLVMTDQSLLARDAGEGSGVNEPAHLIDYGPIPANVARRLVFGPSAGTPMWIRRLYLRPESGDLAAMDSRRRRFTASQRHFLRLRDLSCRTPYCDAPIRHFDHVVPVESGGPTSVTNGQGYCEACNYSKQAPGWGSALTESPGEFVITTPTGHRYEHAPPDQPGAKRKCAGSPVEQRLAALLAAA